MILLKNQQQLVALFSRSGLETRIYFFKIYIAESIIGMGKVVIK